MPTSQSPHRINAPAKLHLEYLKNVSEYDAVDYAKGYLFNKATSTKLHYGTFSFGNGYIVEIQESGTGLAYTPAIIKALLAKSKSSSEQDVLKVRIATGQGDLYVTCTHLGLEAMLLPAGSSLALDSRLDPDAQQLIAVEHNPTSKLRTTAYILFAASLLVYSMALITKPSAPELTVQTVPVHNLPITYWTSEANWPASKTPTTMRLDKVKKTFVVDVRDNSQPSEQKTIK